MASESAFVAEIAALMRTRSKYSSSAARTAVKKQQKWVVLRRVGSGFKQIESFVRAKRPVVVFAAAVDARQRVFSCSRQVSP